MKRNNSGSSRFTVFGFCIFLGTIAFISTFSVVVFSLVNRYTNGNTVAIVFSVLATIVIGALICTVVDVYRRRIMVEEPVQQILEATHKIASGNFNVKLKTVHEYSKYDSYDLIFENINIMTNELAKNEVLKTDFISNVSHEIKTPLAVIQNYAKALQMNGLTDSKRQEYLNGLITQTNKLSNLISNILKLNKLENQKIVPEIEELDLAELVREITLSFENLLEKKNLELECNIDETKILGSASLIEIVLNNLISNAIKFTNPNGKITISLSNEKDCAIIKVKDTGLGISKEVGEHIFDKFYQGDTSHSGEGNGLGLALVKKVIDVMGGEINVESKVGVGTTFIVKLKKDSYEFN